MSNSPLATYSHITDKCNDRVEIISKITIHHMAEVMTGKACADYFCRTERTVSANYCIGYEGDIALNVPENKRAWTSSSSQNDQKAITIEVSNSYKDDRWLISDKSMKALIDLCADIIRRNPGIDRLVYDGTPAGSLTLHEMFSNTNCPGPYMKKKIDYVCNQVNSKVIGKPSKTNNKCPYFKPSAVLNINNASKGSVYGGSSGVKWVQWYLTKLKYYTGDIDGYFNRMTDLAVRAFQKSHKSSDGHKLVIDGNVGPKTRDSIEVAYNSQKSIRVEASHYRRPTITLNSKNASKGKLYGGTTYVKYVQDLLYRGKYYADQIDGYFGPITEASVKSFQSCNNDSKGRKLKVDGSVGPLTLEAMERVIK